MSTSAPAASPAGLTCSLHAPPHALVGGGVPLRFALHNGGAKPLAVLMWNTPFEHGWFAPYVTVELDRHPVSYQGAMRKRGDPSADQYLQLAPGQTVEAVVDLTQAFELGRPGQLRVTPQLVLLDVTTPDRAPRPRDAHAPQPLTCNAVDIELLAPRA